MKFRRIIMPALAVLTLATPIVARAQGDERLRIFGSVNAAYGKADQLPVDGIGKKGTTDYRVIALQFRYSITDQDQVVTQLVSRRVGTSALNAVYNGITPVWAYYSHKFDNGSVVKAGRVPLPRGIYNEIRFIGTLLPFYRVGSQVYGETLEYIDGVTANKSITAGKFGIDATAFGGGFDINTLFPGASGLSLLRTRLENTVGAQVYVRTPIPGVRIGGFAARYEDNSPDPQHTYMASFDGDWDKAFVKAEWTQFKDPEPVKADETDYRGYYALAGIRATEKVTLAGIYERSYNMVGFPAGLTPSTIDLPYAKDLGVGVTYHQSANVAFKLEGHTRTGYFFDAAVPLFKIAPPNVSLAPESKSNYMLASVAITF